MAETIQLSQTFSAPVEKVFSIFADHATFGKKIAGAPIKRIKDAEGDDPNGTGSIREIGIAPMTLEETVLEYIPNEKIVYTVTKGSMIKKHLGEILFTKIDNGCQVDYSIQLTGKPKFVGKPIASALRLGLSRNMAKLAQSL